MIFQENNVKRIAKIDECLSDVIIARSDSRDLFDVARIIYWQLERTKGDILNGTP